MDTRRDEQSEEGVTEDTEVHAEKEDSQDRLGEEIESLQKVVSQLDSQLKRSLADYQNLQRRTQEEKREWIRMANKDLILKFLPVLDTLMLAAKHIQDKGLNMSIDQFLRTLSEEGLERIATVGQEFDPRTMEAVTTQEVEDKKGQVVEEVRAGYLFGDTVLRAAQVIVGQ